MSDMGSMEEQGMLKYCLADALEINYSRQKRVVETVLKKLLKRPIKDFNLYPFRSFALEDALVVIQDGNGRQPRELYLLDALKGSFRIYSIDGRSRSLVSSV